MMLNFDEVEGVYIAWGRRKCLQRTKLYVVMLKLMNVKQVPTRVGWEGMSPMGTCSECCSRYKN